MNLFKKEDKLKYTINYSDPHADILLADYMYKFIKKYNFKKWVIVCIGTDRSTGDSLGPLVGSKLKLQDLEDFVVLGTLDEPVHAINLDDTIQFIKNTYPDYGILSIDASLGQLSSVGNLQIIDGPLKPGAGVKKELTEIGDFHITGIVNVGGFMEYFVLQNTRLSIVMRMSDIVSLAIAKLNSVNKGNADRVVNN